MQLLVSEVAQAVLQAGDLAEPLHLAGLFEPFAGVGLDLDQSWQLGGVGAEHGAADAPLTELTVGYRLVGGRLRGGVASLSA